ncbi:MAG: FadR/GntR family transcriptional regulator [Burkholderiales bacterium]
MTEVEVPKRARALALGLVESFADCIRGGRLAVGEKLPTEAELMAKFGVSRTVVREAISRLAAGGLVDTRHGVGTFVLADREAPLRLSGADASLLHDVVAVVELRLGLETEAAALAAVRRIESEMRELHEAHAELAHAIKNAKDTVAPDVRLHLAIARATHNPHFVGLMTRLGSLLIPRSRIDTNRISSEGRSEYLRRVNAEHDSIVNAIANRDPEGARAAMRTHLSNSRERLRRAQAEPTTR